MVNKINIEGIAVVEGISRNKVKYMAKELSKFAPTMIGRPILKDHVNETDNTIGKITHAESIDNGKRVRYKGWVKEDGSGIIEKIQDGRISEVSIGAIAGRVVKESEEDDYIIAKDMSCLELSTTPCPGVIGTSVSQKENKSNLSEETIKQMIEEFNINESQSNSQSQLSENLNNEKEVIMESNEKQTESTNTTELVALKSQLEESQKTIAALNESMRQDAIRVYNEKAKAKGVSAVNVSEMSMDVIKALTEQVDAIKVEEKKAVEVKEAAKPQSQETSSSSVVVEKFSGCVVEKNVEGVKGFAFYKIK